MSEFQIGDRVIAKDNGHRGVVRGVVIPYVIVEWDDGVVGPVPRSVLDPEGTIAGDQDAEGASTLDEGAK